MKEEQYNKFIKVPALFNNENLLQFSFGPDKRCLLLKESYLSFSIDLPEKFIPDNNFRAKLFEFLDFNINYSDVSFKCSPNDYDYTSFINSQVQKRNFYPFEGLFDNKNYDSSELKSNTDIVDARRGQKIVKTVMEKGVTKEKTYYRYQMMLPINHGLSKGQVLPAGVHFQLTFHRANAKKGTVTNL